VLGTAKPGIGIRLDTNLSVIRNSSAVYDDTSATVCKMHQVGYKDRP